MNSSIHAQRLCLYGVLLFLFGLLNGGLIPVLTNPRMGLSAHLAGVQNGMALLLFGLLWPRLTLSASRQKLTAQLGIASLYGIWIALLLAAIFGTSAATPIAGAGFSGSAWQELVVSALLGTGSVGIIVAVLLMLSGLRGAATADS